MLENKAVAVLDEGLPLGVAFNTLAHLALAVGSHAKGHMGREELVDASGGRHAGLGKYPFIILKASSVEIGEIVKKAKAGGEVLVVDFPEEAYLERTDDGLAEALSKKPGSKLRYYGVALYGSTGEVDGFTKGLALWK